MVDASGAPDGAADVPLGRAALVAALSAMVVNASIYLLSVALGAFDALGWFPASREDEMTLGPVLLVSLVSALVGVGVFGIVRRRVERAFRSFAVIAGVVLVVSFVGPLVMDWPPAQVLVLELMHVATAAAVLWAVRPAQWRGDGPGSGSA